MVDVLYVGKQGAKQIVENGEFPRTASALREVRGIGDYTAGAIASIAFNEVIYGLATRDMSVCVCISIPFSNDIVAFLVVTGCPCCGWKCGTSDQQTLCHCRQPKRILNNEEILVSNTALLVDNL